MSGFVTLSAGDWKQEGEDDQSLAYSLRQLR